MGPERAEKLDAISIIKALTTSASRTRKIASLYIAKRFDLQAATKSSGEINESKILLVKKLQQCGPTVSFMN